MKEVQLARMMDDDTLSEDGGTKSANSTMFLPYTLANNTIVVI